MQIATFQEKTAPDTSGNASFRNKDPGQSGDGGDLDPPFPQLLSQQQLGDFAERMLVADTAGPGGAEMAAFERCGQLHEQGLSVGLFPTLQPIVDVVFPDIEVPDHPIGVATGRINRVDSCAEILGRKDFLELRARTVAGRTEA